MTCRQYAADNAGPRSHFNGCFLFCTHARVLLTQTVPSLRKMRHPSISLKITSQKSPPYTTFVPLKPYFTIY